MISKYKKLLVEKNLLPNFFAIEVIGKIYHAKSTGERYGVVELYEKIEHPKPTFSSYRKLISDLESAGCIAVTISEAKMSKKIISLHNAFEQRINLIGCNFK